jgi:hypothetical protein
VDLIDIALIVALVWGLCLSCVLALLTAAKVADEADERDRGGSSLPGHAGSRRAAPVVARRRRGAASERYLGVRPFPRR